MRWEFPGGLPPVLLLLGPPDCGAASLAEDLRLRASSVLDRLWVSRLDTAAASYIQRFALSAPSGNCKVIVIDLDGGSAAAQNQLLKLLEEPPPTVRFILLATEWVMPTIRSRAQVYYLGEGTEDLSGGKTAVLTALKAAVAGNRDQLTVALRNWDERTHKILGIWCQEKLTGRWHHFSDTDVPGVPAGFAERLYYGLVLSARPKLAARTALEAAARTEK